MKKMTAAILALMMMMTAALAMAESGEKDLFALLRGRVFEFASGAGGWSTELEVGENGAFTGNFHDSEMGETGEGYPDGTLYGCSFHGQFSDPVQVDEYTWTVKVTVEMDEGQAAETIQDNIRYITSTPYGMDKPETVTVYLPGVPVSRLPEEFMFWTLWLDLDPAAETFPMYAIWNEAEDAGFMNWVTVEEPAV